MGVFQSTSRFLNSTCRDDAVHKTYGGLENLGNTCFMNGVLQQIFMMPKIRELLLCKVEHHKLERSNNELVNILQYTMNTLELRQTCTPHKFSSHVGFQEGMMNDSHVFFSVLLDRVCNSPGLIDSDLIRGIRQELELRVVLQRTFQCENNKNIKDKKGYPVLHTYLIDETTFCLCLPSGRSITECLQQFTDEVEFKGKKCTECGNKFPGTQRRLFTKLPETLCLHVERVPLSVECEIDDNIVLEIQCPDQNLFRPSLPSSVQIQMTETTDTPSRKQQNKKVSSLAKYRWFEFVIEHPANFPTDQKRIVFTFHNLPTHEVDTFDVLRDRNDGLDAAYHTSTNQSAGSRSVSTETRTKYEFCICIKTASTLMPQIRLDVSADEEVSGSELARTLYSAFIICQYPAPKKQNYRFVGCVIHRGTRESGHNYSYIKSRESDNSNWYRFDDTRVDLVEKDHEETVFHEARKYAVMAVYEAFEPPPMRVDPREPEEDEETTCLLLPSSRMRRRSVQFHSTTCRCRCTIS